MVLGIKNKKSFVFNKSYIQSFLRLYLWLWIVLSAGTYVHAPTTRI